MALLTVVMAVFNRAEFVRGAVESLHSQPVPEGDVESIVIDGGSTDGTVEVLSGYPSLNVVSERDNGIYDAMNKGIRMARGEFIGLLNSDDRYPPDALAHVLRTYREGVDMVGGLAKVVDATRPERPTLQEYEASDPPLRLFDITRGVPRINAWFIRRQLFEEIGLFDTDLQAAADREWLLRAWMAGVEAKSIPVPVYEYGEHRGSLTFNRHMGQRFRHEHLEICRRYLASPDIPPRLRRELRTWQAQLRAGGLRDDLRSRGVRALASPVMAPSWRDVPWLARAGVQRRRGSS